MQLNGQQRRAIAELRIRANWLELHPEVCCPDARAVILVDVVDALPPARALEIVGDALADLGNVRHEAGEDGQTTVEYRFPSGVMLFASELTRTLKPDDEPEPVLKEQENG